MSGRIDHMFDRLDQNDDGAVDRSEMAKHGRHHKHHGDRDDGEKDGDKS
jgi:hypothetical protein